MGFRGVVEAYMEAVADLARTIFRIWACGFGLPLNYFDRMMDAPIAQLRLIHYPPTIDPTDKNFLGIGSHCDYEALTILCQDDVGGLQVMNHNREWIDATPIPGTFVVNIGEMMARWTNDIFCATPHRVINRSQRDRYSIPFFFGPNYDAEIACLSPCVQGVQAQYTPVIAGEYLSGRLKEIYGT
jgi:isopenicillin N synthase-like dioxygenase